MLAGILLGGAIEGLQGLSGYRSCDIGDFWADCIGILLGGGLVLHRKRIKSKTGFVK